MKTNKWSTNVAVTGFLKIMDALSGNRKHQCSNIKYLRWVVMVKVNAVC